MQTITVKLDRARYQIRVGAGLFTSLAAQLAECGLQEPYLVVSQPRILKAIGKGLPKSFAVVLLPDGEKAKSLGVVNRVVDTMVEHGMTRQSTVIALGGGVVGDVAGFVASLYMRGIAVVQVPTTILAQVDSSVGGKTGVNHRVAKNLIGTFHQPSLVIADPLLLRTLPEREYVSGLFEALKYGVITAPGLFAEFESGARLLRMREPGAVERMVAQCLAIKAAVVTSDEREGGLRRILNFGHTIGHGLEAAGQFRRLKHGEAVGYGMIAACRISAALGKLAEPDCRRIEKAIRSLGTLPGLDGIQPGDVLAAVQHDKKVRDGAVHFVLPRAIGRVEITPDVPLALVRSVVKGLLGEGKKTS